MQFDDLSHLLTIAEVAAAFTGFAGVVSVFGRSRLHASMRLWRVQTLIVTSISALFGALLPALVTQVAPSAEGALRSSAALLFGIVCAQLINVHRTCPPELGTGFFRLASNTIGMILTVTSIVAQVLLLCVAFGGFAAYGLAIYTGSVLFLLMAASYHFLVLVRSIQPEDGEA